MLSHIVKALYAEAPTKPLFHYTSLEGLKGIVSTRTLWASEIRYLNDLEELRHINGWLQHELSRRLHDKDNCAEHIRNVLEQLSLWLPARLRDGPMLFVASFTENGNLLSQWRGYCANGSGVSIGFAPTKIIMQAASSEYLIARCLYGGDEKRSLARGIVDAVLHRAAEVGPSGRAHPDNSYHHVFQEAEPDLLRIAALIKDQSFHEEVEWRLVSPIQNNYVTAPIEYRAGKTMLIPYIEFPLARNNQGGAWFDLVVVGPTPEPNFAIGSVSRFLSRAGIHPMVSNCMIPYRS